MSTEEEYSYEPSMQQTRYKDTNLTIYQLETEELIKDVIDILENRTLMNPETGLKTVEEGHNPLVDEKSIQLIKLTLKLISNKTIALSLLQEKTSENCASGTVKRIQYLLIENREYNKLSQTQRSLLLYNLQILILALLNKAIKWKTLEESNKVRTVTEVINDRGNTKKGFFTK